MAKGQKRSNREIKKPKAVKKPAASDADIRTRIAGPASTAKATGKSPGSA